MGHTSSNFIQPYLQLIEEHHKTIISSLRKEQTNDHKESSREQTQGLKEVSNSNSSNATVSTPKLSLKIIQLILRNIKNLRFLFFLNSMI